MCGGTKAPPYENNLRLIAIEMQNQLFPFQVYDKLYINTLYAWDKLITLVFSIMTLFIKGCFFRSLCGHNASGGQQSVRDFQGTP